MKQMQCGCGTEVKVGDTCTHVTCWKCFMFGKEHEDTETVSNEQEVVKQEVKQEAVQPVAAAIVPPVVAKNKPSVCPTCNGPAKGRGYRHTDTCPASVKNKK